MATRCRGDQSLVLAFNHTDARIDGRLDRPGLLGGVLHHTQLFGDDVATKTDIAPSEIHSAACVVVFDRCLRHHAFLARRVHGAILSFV